MSDQELNKVLNALATTAKQHQAILADILRILKEISRDMDRLENNIGNRRR